MIGIMYAGESPISHVLVPQNFSHVAHKSDLSHCATSIVCTNMSQELFNGTCVAKCRDGFARNMATGICIVSGEGACTEHVCF